MLQSNYEQSRETRTPKICYNQNKLLLETAGFIEEELNQSI
jgi:hypothetical protein